MLPYAAPGIFTGTILSLARAFGETAPIIMVGAIVGTFNSVLGPIDQLFERFTALPTDRVQLVAAAAGRVPGPDRCRDRRPARRLLLVNAVAI